jgi:hypothetical protein
VTSVIGLAFLVAHFLWRSHSNCSCCPLLRATLSSSLIRSEAVQLYNHQPRPRVNFWLVKSKVLRVVNAPTSPALQLTVVSSLFQRGSTTPQCPVTHFPKQDGNLDYSFCNLQSESLPDILFNDLPRPWSLIPLMCFSCTQLRFPTVHPLGAPCTALSLPGL